MGNYYQGFAREHIVVSERTASRARACYMNKQACFRSQGASKCDPSPKDPQDHRPEAISKHVGRPSPRTERQTCRQTRRRPRTSVTSIISYIQVHVAWFITSISMHKTNEALLCSSASEVRSHQKWQAGVAANLLSSQGFRADKYMTRRKATRKNAYTDDLVYKTDVCDLSSFIPVASLSLPVPLYRSDVCPVGCCL